tara:strand:- start:342 stop:773 length:432 start_codon:yes stop_codon:yes gene_type:complete
VFLFLDPIFVFLTVSLITPILLYNPLLIAIVFIYLILFVFLTGTHSFSTTVSEASWLPELPSRPLISSSLRVPSSTFHFPLLYPFSKVLLCPSTFTRHFSWLLLTPFVSLLAQPPLYCSQTVIPIFLAPHPHDLYNYPLLRNP